MKKIFGMAGIILLFAALSLTSGCSESGKSKIKAQPQIKVVALGDSLTNGFPFGPEFSWVRLSSARLGIPIENMGVCGETTGEMLTRMDRVIAQKPTHLIIFGGTNDALYRLSYDEVTRNITEIADKAEENNIKVIIALPIPVNDLVTEQRLSGFRHWMIKQANQNNWPVLDFYSLLKDGSTGMLKDEYNFDNIHPNYEGYNIMANAVGPDLFR